MATDDNDTQVPFQQTIRMKVALDGVGAKTELVVIPHANHKSLPLDLWSPVNARAGNWMVDKLYA